MRYATALTLVSVNSQSRFESVGLHSVKSCIDGNTEHSVCTSVVDGLAVCGGNCNGDVIHAFNHDGALGGIDTKRSVKRNVDARGQHIDSGCLGLSRGVACRHGIFNSLAFFPFCRVVAEACIADSRIGDGLATAIDIVSGEFGTLGIGKCARGYVVNHEDELVVGCAADGYVLRALGNVNGELGPCGGSLVAFTDYGEVLGLVSC